MNLYELPSELLVLIFESLPDIWTLHSLIKTCKLSKDVYFLSKSEILNSVINNAYPDFGHVLRDVVSTRKTSGELDYAYVGDGRIEWIYPSEANSDQSKDLLQDHCDSLNDAENLARSCTPLLGPKYASLCDERFTMLGDVTRAILQLQLLTNRLFHVRLPAFPEHISLRAHERATLKSYLSRKTRDQARDLMKDQLIIHSTNELRKIWMLLQVLQDEYLRLRRHRLRPCSESLMDLLFEHGTNEAVWSISPWDSVQSILSERGIHVVPPRPAIVIRFRGSEPSHEPQEKDIDQFYTYMTSKSGQRAGSSFSPESSSKYLDRFRPLMGLPYLNFLPIPDFVTPSEPISKSLETRRTMWVSVRTEQSALEIMLDHCADTNRDRRENKWEKLLGLKNLESIESFV